MRLTKPVTHPSWQALLPPLHRMLFDHARATAAAGTADSSDGSGRISMPGGVRLAAAVRAAAVGCGAPQLASVLQRLAWHANQTLFRQLSAWCAPDLLRASKGVDGVAVGLANEQLDCISC